jgi:hypothetical protein
MGRPAQSQVAVQVGEQVMGLPVQSQVAVQVGEQRAGAMGCPWQSHVAVQVGEQRPGATAAAMGRPAQSQVAVQVGEHRAAATMGTPAQSQVAVQVGEQRLGATAAAMGRPAQSQVAVQVGEQRPAAVVAVGVAANDFCVEVGVGAGVEVGATAAAGPASPPCTSCWKSLRTSGSLACWAKSTGGVPSAGVAAPAFAEPSGPMASTITSFAFLQAPSPETQATARSQPSKRAFEVRFRMAFAPPKVPSSLGAQGFMARGLGQS